MAQQFIDKGTGANTGTGTPARTAADIINNNFAELYAKHNPTPLRIIKHPDNSGAGVELLDLVEVYLNDGSNDYLVLLKYTNALDDDDTVNYGTGPDFEDGNYEWIKTEYSN